MSKTPPQDYFYHYTSRRALEQIFNIYANPNDEEGLQPRRRFVVLGDGKGLPDKAHDSALWGMLEERPASYTELFWHTQQSFFKDCIDHALDRATPAPTYLLKIHVTPEDDVYVADWGVHLRADFNGTEMEDKSVVHAVKRAYWDSLVPLADYDPAKPYKIPEVVCFNAIPPERIEVVKAIPGSEIERYIETGEFDPAALEKDKITAKERSERMSRALLDFMAKP